MQAQLVTLQKEKIEEDSWKKDIAKEEIEESGEEPWQKKEKYKEKKKIDWRKGVEKFEKEREEEGRDIWKRLDSVEDIGKGMDGFWNAVEEKEVVKKKPKVEATTPRIPAVGRGSGFWKR